MAEIHINNFLTNKRQMLTSIVKNVETMGIDLFSREHVPTESRIAVMEAVACINHARRSLEDAAALLEQAKVWDVRAKSQPRTDVKNSKLP